MNVNGFGTHLKSNGTSKVTISGTGLQEGARVCLKPSGTNTEWGGWIKKVVRAGTSGGGHVDVAICHVKVRDCDSLPVDPETDEERTASIVIDNPNGAEIEITVTNPPPSNGGDGQSDSNTDEGAYGP